MCTSFTIKAEDGSPLYGRTMEWGGFDFQSELILVPRGTPFTSALTDTTQGMTWENQFGFIAINAVNLPIATDGMNETGLVVGVLYMPGFAQFQEMVKGEEATTLANTDLAGYILGQFDNVKDVKTALPNLRVVYSEVMAKAFGAPAPLHLIIIDATGESIVVEYVAGELNMHDNKIGVMTNSPSYDWHLVNLRNYTNLQPKDLPGDREINGVNLAPIGVGSGMLGLPGDITPPSRFVRAVAYTQTLLPFPDAESGIPQLATVLHNFDIPIGLVQEGVHKGHVMAGQTQWSIIGDLKNRRYYYWTEHNSRLRLVDLSRLDFAGGEVQSISLDEVQAQDVQDRTQDFFKRSA